MQKITRVLVDPKTIVDRNVIRNMPRRDEETTDEYFRRLKSGAVQVEKLG